MSRRGARRRSFPPRRGPGTSAAAPATVPRCVHTRAVGHRRTEPPRATGASDGEVRIGRQVGPKESTCARPMPVPRSSEGNSRPGPAAPRPGRHVAAPRGAALRARVRTPRRDVAATARYRDPPDLTSPRAVARFLPAARLFACAAAPVHPGGPVPAARPPPSLPPAPPRPVSRAGRPRPTASACLPPRFPRPDGGSSLASVVDEIGVNWPHRVCTSTTRDSAVSCEKRGSVRRSRDDRNGDSIVRLTVRAPREMIARNLVVDGSHQPSAPGSTADQFLP